MKLQKNNITKFEGDDFMFELNDEEVENLSRCKNFTLNTGRGFGDNVRNGKIHNIEFTGQSKGCAWIFALTTSGL